MGEEFGEVVRVDLFGEGVRLGGGVYVSGDVWGGIGGEGSKGWDYGGDQDVFE